MDCLLQLPDAVHKVVLRNVTLMNTYLLFTKRRSYEDSGITVDRFTIHLPRGTDRSWVLTEKWYEVVYAYVEPLSPDEMEHLRRHSTLDAPDDIPGKIDRYYYRVRAPLSVGLQQGANECESSIKQKLF